MGTTNVGVAMVALALTVVSSASVSAAGQTQPPGRSEPPQATPFNRLFKVPQVAPPRTNVDLITPSIDLKALARRTRFAGLVRGASTINCVASRALPADPALDPSMLHAAPRTPRSSARTLPLPPACISVSE